MQYRLWLILAVLLDLSWNGIAILGKKLLVRITLLGPRKKQNYFNQSRAKGSGLQTSFCPALYIFIGPRSDQIGP